MKCVNLLNVPPASAARRMSSPRRYLCKQTNVTLGARRAEPNTVAALVSLNVSTHAQRAVAYVVEHGFSKAYVEPRPHIVFVLYVHKRLRQHGSGQRNAPAALKHACTSSISVPHGTLMNAISRFL